VTGFARRAAAIIAGLFTTTAGYIVGTFAYKKAHNTVNALLHWLKTTASC
jgi:uncharacterized membrane protein YphA (DoxX/SURF4 family)